MKQKIYQAIITKVIARQNCIESNNQDWIDRHETALEKLQDMLPSGSGIDSGCTIDMDKSTDDRLIINSSYHCMDEHGYYDGWIDFNVIVKPSLSFGATVDITGYWSQRGYKYWHTREYLQELFDRELNQEIETDDLYNNGDLYKHKLRKNGLV